MSAISRQVFSDMNAINAPLRVLVADDDLDLLALLGFALRKAGFEVDTVSSGRDALQALAQQQYSLLLLDINMPAPDGLQVCAQVREHSTLPILIISARGHEADHVHALEVGADGYVTKPFSPRALIARIRALLRRALSLEQSSAAALITVSDFQLNIEAHTLLSDDHEIQLTRLETRIVQLLMMNAGHTVSTKALITAAWDAHQIGNRNMLKQVVFRLRRKLQSQPKAYAALTTVTDGYMWGSHGDAPDPPANLQSAAP